MKIFSWNGILGFLNTGIQDDFFSSGTGISVGCFDGIHKGHGELLGKLVHGCKDLGLKSGVVTFTRPLPSIKHSGDYSGDISSLKQRLAIFEKFSIDFAIIVDFDDEFSSQLGADFLNVLVNACNMELLAEGVDFRCGYKGATDVQAIKYFCEHNNVKTVFVEPVYYREGTDEEERISSSYIRNMVCKGFFTTVEELLDRPYEIDISDCEKFFVGVAAGAGRTGGSCHAGSKFEILKKNIIQVLPPNGVYRVNDQLGREIRVEVNDEKLIFKVIDKGEGEVSSVLFK